MIVCHCLRLSDHDIRRAIDETLASRPDALITPHLVYESLGGGGRCRGCYPLALEVIRRHLAARAGVPGAPAAHVDPPARTEAPPHRPRLPLAAE